MLTFRGNNEVNVFCLTLLQPNRTMPKNKIAHGEKGGDKLYTGLLFSHFLVFSYSKRGKTSKGGGGRGFVALLTCEVVQVAVR